MYLIVLWIFMLKLQPSILRTVMPQHMDFQKVGEVIFNNEKYNILKPTTHFVSDYFEDYMLKRDNEDFPSKRRFIDDNGLRHYWTGFEKKTKSLRKTELISDALETEANDKDSNRTENSDNIQKGKSTEIVENVSDKTINSNGTVEDNISKETNTKASDEVIDEEDKGGTNKSDEEVTTTLHTTFKETPRRKKRPTFATEDPEIKMRVEENQNKFLKQGGRTIAKTSFFCPFFGIVTMSAFVD